MEQLQYERPREKLRNRGARSLSTAELLQLVIGSGTKGAGGPRLARLVESLTAQKQVTYTALVAIPGIGHAKACQLLAVFELIRRGGTL